MTADTQGRLDVAPNTHTRTLRTGLPLGWTQKVIYGLDKEMKSIFTLRGIFASPLARRSTPNSRDTKLT